MFIADTLKKLIELDKISLQSLYEMSEKQIINIIKNEDLTKKKWNIFEKSDTLIRTNIKPENKYYVSLKTKKRYVIPLINFENKTVRLNKISNKCQKLLEEYLDYKDTEYSYIEL